MRVIFFGTPAFAVPTLEALAAAGHEVCLVVSRPDRPSGRHLRLAVPEVVEASRRLGLPLLQPEKIGTDDFHRRLGAARAEAAVVVAYGKIIPGRLLKTTRRGFVNLHPSLLPRHRGPSPIQWAIVSGDEVTGVTTMLLDAGMDTGPILLQRETPIGPRERAPELEHRLAPMGAGLVVETLAAMEAGSVTPRPQDGAAATVTPKLDRKIARVEWSLPARELAWRSRGLDPWPGLFATFRGSRVKIHSLEAGPDTPGDEAPGTVVSVTGAGVAVRCGGGTVVLLTELQREGKRRLPADAFIIGERVAKGERFH